MKPIKFKINDAARMAVQIYVETTRSALKAACDEGLAAATAPEPITVDSVIAWFDDWCRVNKDKALAEWYARIPDSTLKRLDNAIARLLTAKPEILCDGRTLLVNSGNNGWLLGRFGVM